MSSHPFRFILLVVIFLGLAAGLYLLLPPRTTPQVPVDSNPVACTLEAKICPDGTAVGRTGPNCEFAACPEVTSTTPVTSPTTTTSTVTFDYQKTIVANYISTVDWPPQAQVLNEPFTCTEAGLAINRAGRTEKHEVNGRTYCVTTVSEGAAGSMYNEYAYAFPKENKTVILTFTLRFPQCANYDEPKKTSCETEQRNFELDKIVDLMAESVKF